MSTFGSYDDDPHRPAHAPPAHDRRRGRGSDRGGGEFDGGGSGFSDSRFGNSNGSNNNDDDGSGGGGGGFAAFAPLLQNPSALSAVAGSVVGSRFPMFHSATSFVGRLGSSSFATVRHHFQVNELYVAHKLRILLTLALALFAAGSGPGSGSGSESSRSGSGSESGSGLGSKIRQWLPTADAYLRNWSRRTTANGRPFPPRDDINAPDLYIPLMALCTTIVLFGVVMGQRYSYCMANRAEKEQLFLLNGANPASDLSASSADPLTSDSKKPSTASSTLSEHELKRLRLEQLEAIKTECVPFNPEVLRQRAMFCLVFLAIEVFVVRIVLYFLYTREEFDTLDIVAYCGYVFVGTSISGLCGWILGTLGFVVAWLYTSSCIGIFVNKTFRAFLSASPNRFRNYFVAILSVAQIPLVYILSPPYQ